MGLNPSGRMGKTEKQRTMAKGRFKNPVEAVFTGIKDFNKRKSNVRDLTDADRLDGKSVMVTGANSGVGFAIAEQVARRLTIAPVQQRAAAARVDEEASGGQATARGLAGGADHQVAL